MSRTGGQALALLAAPLNVEILRALEEEPRNLLDLRQAVGSPPQSTMRVYTRTLAELGVLARQRRNEFPATAEYSLTAAGQALIAVADVLEEWLQAAPHGQLTIGSVAAKSATKALVGGWSANIVRALAARSLTLTELNFLIPKISYPSLERRLGAMRLANLIEAQPSNGRGVPYQATEWLHRAVLPLTAAIAWEQQHLREPEAKIGGIDAEAAFLLAIPLISLGSDVTGKCRLSMEVRSGTEPAFAGVVIGVEAGKVTSCSARLKGHAEASASGTPGAWIRQLAAATEPHLELEMSGDSALARAVVEALQALSPAQRAARAGDRSNSAGS
ncbi:MAG TPA: winged helix-turn-helix transcriptional regulator [Solirubrobacterales bacterium]|nr:winged helix-turn-helix transcriptional regulator [Solirubrobacterales bacterium]